MKNNKEILVFSGNANRDLAKKICNYLKVQLGNAQVDRFNDGEVRIRIAEDVRGRDVFIVQPTCNPVNDNLMELLIMTDAIRRSSARRITAVMPYYGYSRQDRKDRPRVPITAKLVANLITVAGANRVLTMDLHAGQIQGFFDIPLDNLFAVNTFMKYFEKMHLPNLVVVSPDVGGMKMARAYAKKFKAGLAVVDKRRINDKEAEVMNIMGEVKGKNVCLIDDLVATAGTLVEAVAALKNAGARKVFAAATHAVLSGPAIERIENSELEELIVTDTIPIPREKMIPRIKVLSVGPLLGQAIERIHYEKSISTLFDKVYQ
ncbi:MAG: ribose-phosphate pyrophosphokinase [Candidatus Omnitrophica bacterium]|nr:ribose-phosphate pyrophosphokinase [Candidatus Omnitrophota bacterium]MDD5310869.1 ribose-phosphate pyrophosphokinase [Candidatus Omnitrophota bacterium]MDD5546365.1 ribose-phosphate pyrophosphokinase [Candidatus Omnitrophota bacterium]